MNLLAGKTAVITGGGRGLGSAIATSMAAEGAHAVVVDRNGDAASDVVAQIHASGGSASAEILDIGDREAVMAFGGHMLDRYDRIDVLVNNAGIAPRIRPQDPDQMQKWDQVISVNLTGGSACRALVAPVTGLSAGRRPAGPVHGLEDL